MVDDCLAAVSMAGHDRTVHAVVLRHHRVANTLVRLHINANALLGRHAVSMLTSCMQVGLMHEVASNPQTFAA